MISDRRTADLRSQLRYAEIRAVLIAAFSAYMLPDLGRELYTIALVAVVLPSVLSAFAWLAIIANHLYSPRIDLHFSEMDEREEFRVLEHLQYRQSRYLRLSLIASCLSVVSSVLIIGFHQFYRF